MDAVAPSFPVHSSLAADDSSIKWENPDTPTSAEDYVVIDGRRLVRPYFFEFLAHVKRRWEGKNIVDLFAQEFRQRPMQYYIDAIDRGRILVDGKKVEKTFVVRDSQPISHFVHRHEPPVLSESVRILEEGPDVLTVCKPPSVPVHACGQYRKNTVIGILQAEHNAGPLFPIHRLDRLVSGLLILARNARTADSFREEIEGGRVSKEYVAKVVGVFPENEMEVNAAVLYDKREGLSTVEAATTSLPGEHGQESAAKGKDAFTRFSRLSTDGKNSIVKCVPLTGRTHQIRVHLKHLGHPIANDALYLHKAVAKRSREATTADQAAARVASTSSRQCSSCTRSRILPSGSDAKNESFIRSTADDCAVKNIPTMMTSHWFSDSDCYIGTGAAKLQVPDKGAGEKPLEAQVRVSSQGMVHERGKKSIIYSGNVGTDTPGQCTAGGLAYEKLSGAQVGVSSQGMGHDGGEKSIIQNGNVDTGTVVQYTGGGLGGTPEQRTLQGQQELSGGAFTVDPLCTHCPRWEPAGYEEDVVGIWLHCVKYSCEKWSYQSPLPSWAM